MTRDLVHVKQASEEIVLVLGSEDVRLVADQATRGRRSKMSQDGHQIRTGPGMVIDDVVILAVDTAVDGMDQAVTEAAARVHQEGSGEDPLAAGGKDHLDRIIHAAGHDRLDAGTVRAGAKDVRGARDQGRPARSLVSLLGEGTLAPVDPAVRAQVRAVQVVGAAGQRLAVEPDLALVRLAVVVGVRQLPDLRRGADVDRPAIPQDPLREHHLVGEHGRLVEHPGPLGVFEADDPVRRVLDLLGDFLIRAR